MAQAPTNAPVLIQMSGWVALENRGRIYLSYISSDARGYHYADGTPLKGDNEEEMSFTDDRQPWKDFDLAKGRVFLATIDEEGATSVRQLENVTIPKSVLGAAEGRKIEQVVGRVVKWWLNVNPDQSGAKQSQNGSESDEPQHEDN